MRIETQMDIEEDEDDLEPPFVIVVQGSRESGKTTVIKSLVQHLTHDVVAGDDLLGSSLLPRTFDGIRGDDEFGTSVL